MQTVYVRNLRLRVVGLCWKFFFFVLFIYLLNLLLKYAELIYSFQQLHAATHSTHTKTFFFFFYSILHHHIFASPPALLRTLT